MQILVIQRILGLFLVVFSFTMIPPMIVAFVYLDGAFVHFFHAASITILTGLILWLPVKHYKHELRKRDGFIIVVLFWTVLCIFGAIPLYLFDELNMSLVDAFFESISGLTTTGATVITHIDDLPKSILFYRQQMQWLGGMGIIVLAVAIMPMLGIGGMQLYRAETPGPMKDNKLTPRISGTAKALWYIYLVLTISCAISYWLAGMTPFDAICHSFSTIAIGGFSTHDASMGYFSDTPLVEIVATVFMILAGVNFALHFTAWRSRSVRKYFCDSELKTYIITLFIVSAIVCLYLIQQAVFSTTTENIVHGLFQTVSIATTTGFTTTDYNNWPAFVPVILIFLSFIGACAGSTGGGMKVIRFLLLLKQGYRELLRVIHPNAIITIKIGGKPLAFNVIDAVWGFFSAYIAFFVLIMLILMFTGLDQITAFSAVAASMNNLGPGLGAVALNYSEISDTAKLVLSFAMLLGRLEIFTLLVLLSPSFWRN